MSMDIAIGLAIGILIGGTVAGVYLGNLAHQHYEAYKAQQAITFGLEQTLIHELEGQMYPKYVMRSDGVDAVVERNRPDIKDKLPDLVMDGTVVVDLTEVEDA